jgi:hypothetical protein
MYRLHLIHCGQAQLAHRLRAQLASDLADLGFDPGRLDILENADSHTSDTIALGLYLASVEGRSDRGCNERIERLAATSIPIVPLVAAGAGFADLVPDTLHPINAFDTSSLPKVSATVLRWLGLLDRDAKARPSLKNTGGVKGAACFDWQKWQCSASWHEKSFLAFTTSATFFG